MFPDFGISTFNPNFFSLDLISGDLNEILSLGVYDNVLDSECPSNCRFIHRKKKQGMSKSFIQNFISIYLCGKNYVQSTMTSLPIKYWFLMPWLDPCETILRLRPTYLGEPSMPSGSRTKLSALILMDPRFILDSE
jgi:hypothetical protein